MEQINIMLYFSAMTLGAFHAFEPGHGKTVIAAYMIGTKGRVVDGIILGLVVTFTHTFSVIALGILAKFLSHTYSEASLHNWMGLFSAILILSVGLWMLKTRLSGKSSHSHIHFFEKEHDHDTLRHDHKNHEHDHSHKPGLWNLLLLGISGGLVPCPAGIATLLAAIAAGRIAQGLIVTLFFSLGLGLVMMTIGVVLSQAGTLTRKISENMKLGRLLGVLSAVVISTLGVVTLVHSLNEIFCNV